MKKLVLISQQGSGTNLFRSFVNSHPDILVSGEIFTRSDRFEYYRRQALDDKEAVNKYLNESFEIGDNFDKFSIKELEQGEKAEVLGFDLKYNNLKYPSAIIDWLKKDPNVYIIHLFRCKGRTFLRQLNEETFTYNDFEDHIQKVSTAQEHIRKCFSDETYMEITYEDMTRGYEVTSLPKDFEVKILNFLGIEYKKMELSNKLVRKDKMKMRY